jgi:hypothetical protein
MSNLHGASLVASLCECSKDKRCDSLTRIGSKSSAFKASEQTEIARSGSGRDAVKPTARLMAGLLYGSGLPLIELARVLVRFNHIPRPIVNANHGLM